MAAVTRRFISSSLLPKAIGPYSSAVLVDKTLYVSGQIGLDPKTGSFAQGGVGPETKQALDNLGELLKAAGTDHSNVVKSTVLLADIKDYDEVNKIYQQYFTGNYPARSAYAVTGLPKGARVEIEVIAIVGKINNQ